MSAAGELLVPFPKKLLTGFLLFFEPKAFRHREQLLCL